ncbi:MAG: L-threonylcarbamoyladenylate synthase [Ruminococcus sp.]|nr:L-threonylcarbamoyladenylate synthase [Ruminococcus sp.]
MNTVLLKDTDEDIKKAAEIIKNGGLVGMPTETVYGLGANALNPKAVLDIFKAKGRPADNPLIVHISDVSQIEKFSLAEEIPENAKILAEKFWPGPLTMIVKKGKAVPDEVSAGLDTVAIRFPSHPVAQKLISFAGLPVAAPSANLSGSPSPTTPQHVMRDLKGKIPAIIDGGICNVGLESTVITLTENPPRLLRPGGITLEQLRDALGEVALDDAVLHKLKEGRRAASPGMKYKHYAPKANVTILKGGNRDFYDFVNANSHSNRAVICYDEDAPFIKGNKFLLGSKSDSAQQAHRLFDVLRQIDLNPEITAVYARCPDINGVGLAVYNRLIRAAGFEVKDLAEI